jgi:hypothetical protein
MGLKRSESDGVQPDLMVVRPANQIQSRYIQKNYRPE